MPPNSNEFVETSADDAFRLRTAYGALVTSCRGLSVVNNGSAAFFTAISSHRWLPSKMFAVVKSRFTVKMPLLTDTEELVIVSFPIGVPPDAAENNENCIW